MGHWDKYIDRYFQESVDGRIIYFPNGLSFYKSLKTKEGLVIPDESTLKELRHLLRVQFRIGIVKNYIPIFAIIVANSIYDFTVLEMFGLIGLWIGCSMFFGTKSGLKLAKLQLSLEKVDHYVDLKTLVSHSVFSMSKKRHWLYLTVSVGFLMMGLTFIFLPVLLPIIKGRPTPAGPPMWMFLGVGAFCTLLGGTGTVMQGYFLWLRYKPKKEFGVSPEEPPPPIS